MQQILPRRVWEPQHTLHGNSKALLCVRDHWQERILSSKDIRVSKILWWMIMSCLASTDWWKQTLRREDCNTKIIVQTDSNYRLSCFLLVCWLRLWLTVVGSRLRSFMKGRKSRRSFWNKEKWNWEKWDSLGRDLLLTLNCSRAPSLIVVSKLVATLTKTTQEWIQAQVHLYL